MSVPRVDLTDAGPAKRIAQRVAFSPLGQWTLRHISPRVDPDAHPT